VTRANALEDNVVLNKALNGVRSPSTLSAEREGYGTNVKVPADILHRLRIDFSGSHFRVSFNGNNCSRSRIPPSPMPARSGCGPSPNSVTPFDQITYGEAK
jgi:hypothetical protein